MTNDEHDINFFEYLAQAQIEALRERECQIMELRYGLTGGKAATLEAIGNIFGISRERVRQILGKSHKKIYARGRRQIKSGNINESCAELLLYIQFIMRPQDSGVAERLVDFCRNILSCLPQQTHAFQLVVNLLYPDKESKDEILKNAIQITKNSKLKESMIIKLKSNHLDFVSYCHMLLSLDIQKN